MRIIDGYVCVTDVYQSKFQVLFGPAVNAQMRIYENFETNGLTPYTTLADAERGKRKLERRQDLRKRRLARINMVLAENATEITAFREKTELVVVMLGKEESRLLGGYRPALPTAHPLPGSFMIDTGFKTWDTFAEAEHLAGEVQRQGRTPATLGTFSLEYLVNGQKK